MSRGFPECASQLRARRPPLLNAPLIRGRREAGDKKGASRRLACPPLPSPLLLLIQILETSPPPASPEDPPDGTCGWSPLSRP